MTFSVSSITSEKSLIVGTSIAAFVGGVVTGYFLANRRLRQRYADDAHEEILAAKEYYSAIYKKDLFENPYEKAKREVKEAWEEKDNNVNSEEEYEIKGREVVVHTRQPPVDFEDGWDYEAELRNRTADSNYIVSYEEFLENDPQDRVSWIYYSGDDVLVDDIDEPLEDIEDMIGRQNMQFGHGSGDPNVVYIFNHRLKVYAEVTRDPSRFEDVSGIERAT